MLHCSDVRVEDEVVDMRERENERKKERKKEREKTNIGSA